MKRKGFDNDIYIQKQTQYIRERIAKFGGKLYLEFGGKLFDDYHAARVLPGFDFDAKVRLLKEFNDQAEVVFCINAADIEKKKIRADFGITYDMDVLRLIDNLRGMGISVNSVVITCYSGQPSADIFRKKLEMRGEKAYFHYPIKGYPLEVDKVVSDEGYGANPYIETTRPLVVVTAPGPCSGKLATCLSQLYHEYKRGVSAGYAKFETFPIWNIPLKHPVNIAYEAATADLKDVNMIDPWHLDAYGKQAVNYNRDIEVFPIVNNILTKITGQPGLYQSPTDMGVNMAGYGIVDDDAVRDAAKQEIIRRYYAYLCDYKQGRTDLETAQRVEGLMNELGLAKEDRSVVAPALKKAEESGCSAMAVELRDGRIVTGRTTNLMGAAAAVILNSIKVLAGIRDEILLMSPLVLEPILKLKRDYLGSRQNKLTLPEVLVALSICAATSPVAQLALSKLPELRGCEAHSVNMLTASDGDAVRSLGLNLTSEAEYPTKDLYYI